MNDFPHPIKYPIQSHPVMTVPRDRSYWQDVNGLKYQVLFSTNVNSNDSSQFPITVIYTPISCYKPTSLTLSCFLHTMGKASPPAFVRSPETDWFNGLIFVPAHVGLYRRKKEDWYAFKAGPGHPFSYWDGTLWYLPVKENAYYLSKSSGTKELYQGLYFKGLTEKA